MKKLLLIKLFLIIGSISFGVTNWDRTSINPIVIIYKMVDPLVVTVEKPKKIYVPGHIRNFKYSDYSEGKKKIDVKVKTSYTGNIDNILRKIYERVYFELGNNGNFDLRHKDQMDKIIKGKGYFVDEKYAPEGNKVTKYDKSFSSSLPGTSFQTTTQIDADFTKEENLPMGVYRGTLKLNVWFGGTIK